MAGILFLRKKVIDISGSVSDNTGMFSKTRQNVREFSRVSKVPASLREALGVLLIVVLILPAHDGVGAHT